MSCLRQAEKPNQHSKFNINLSPTTCVYMAESGEAKEIAVCTEIDPEEAPFKIQSYDGVCFWKWGIVSEQCAICKFPLAKPSVQYLANPSPAFNAGLKVAFGACDHCFHLDCLERWKKTRGTCPLCNQEWDMLKVEAIPGYEQQLNG